MMDKPYVVIVGREVPPEVEIALRGGVGVKRCHGAAPGRCPVARGERCELRANARAAIVYLSGEHEFHSSAEWDCASAGPSPGIAVLEGSLHPARGHNGFAIVGSAWGPAEVIATLAKVLEDPADQRP
jgi:hypothetical protein